MRTNINSDDGLIAEPMAATGLEKKLRLRKLSAALCAVINAKLRCLTWRGLDGRATLLQCVKGEMLKAVCDRRRQFGLDR